MPTFLILLALGLARGEEPTSEAPPTDEPAAEAPGEDAPPAAEEAPQDPAAVPEAAPAEGGKKKKKKGEGEDGEKEKFIRSDKDYVPKPVRTEWIVFPVIAQNPDVGTMVGLTGGVAHFDPKYDPYQWSIRANAIVSFNQFDGRYRLLMQNYSIGADLPGLGKDGNVRLNPGVTFQRIPNASYYGIGNASGTQPADDTYYYRYDRWMVLTSMPVRWDFGEKWGAGFAFYYRYMDARAYEGSLLEHDLALTDKNGDPILPDAVAHHDLISAAGLFFDTRDWEIDPAAGWFFQSSIRYTFAAATPSRPYFGWNVDLRGYQTLVPEHLVVAERFMSDVMVGEAPFYELDHAGAFPNLAAIGGSKGIRGIPEGRYRGQSKALLTVELRSWLFGHMLGDTHVRAGLEAFVDTGRVWAVTGQRIPELDGTGAGLKYGTGGGFRLGWGEYGVVRIELAWSPHGDPTSPLGLYMDVENTF